MRSSVAFLLPSLLAAWGDYDWENPTEHISVEVMSQSFASPFVYDASYLNWYVTGSTMPVRQGRTGLIMNPALSGRQGIMWNKKPLASNNFDATLTLHVEEDRVNTSSRAPTDQQIAFWFSGTNVSAQVATALKSVEASNPNWGPVLTRGGIDPVSVIPQKFEGVGAILSLVNSAGEKVPTVTLVAGGGAKESAPLLAKSSHLMYLRIKLKIRPDSISLWFQDRMDWRSIVELKTTQAPKRGFIGITSSSGKAPAQEGVAAVKVRVSALHVKSFDLTALNSEENQVVSALFEKEGLSVDKILSDDSYATAADQTDMLERLSRVLDSHMSTHVPSLSRYQDTIGKLQKEISDLDSFIATLTQEARLTFASSKGASLGSLMGEVRSIHSALNQAETDRDKLLQNVLNQRDDDGHHRSVERHLGHFTRTLNSRGTELNAAIESQNRFTLILFLVVFAAAAAMGFAFYVKLNRYGQKAHLF